MKRTYYYETKEQYPPTRLGKATFLTEQAAVKYIKKFVKDVDDILVEIFYERAGPDGQEFITIWKAE